MYHDRENIDFSQGHVTKNQPMAVPVIVEWKTRNITDIDIWTRYHDNIITIQEIRVYRLICKITAIVISLLNL